MISWAAVTMIASGALCVLSAAVSRRRAAIGASAVMMLAMCDMALTGLLQPIVWSFVLVLLGIGIAAGLRSRSGVRPVVSMPTSPSLPLSASPALLPAGAAMAASGGEAPGLRTYQAAVSTASLNPAVGAASLDGSTGSRSMLGIDPSAPRLDPSAPGLDRLAPGLDRLAPEPGRSAFRLGRVFTAIVAIAYLVMAWQVLQHGATPGLAGGFANGGAGSSHSHHSTGPLFGAMMTVAAGSLVSVLCAFAVTAVIRRRPALILESIGMALMLAAMMLPH